MGNKSKQKSASKPSPEGDATGESSNIDQYPGVADATKATTTMPSRNGQNMALLFIRGAMMRAPFLLIGCLVLWALKKNDIISSGTSSSAGETRSFMEFSVLQVFAVNIVSEACVKVWWKFLQEKEKKA